LPEMNAMRGTKIPALAVSAARGTNLGALWLLIERAIAAAPPAVSPVPSRRPISPSNQSTVGEGRHSGGRSGDHDSSSERGGNSCRGGGGDDGGSGRDSECDSERDSPRGRAHSTGAAASAHCSSPLMTAADAGAVGIPGHDHGSFGGSSTATSTSSDSSASVEGPGPGAPHPIQAEDACACACISGGSSPSPASILYQHEYGAFHPDPHPDEDGSGRELAFEHSIVATPSVAMAA